MRTAAVVLTLVVALSDSATAAPLYVYSNFDGGDVFNGALSITGKDTTGSEPDRDLAYRFTAESSGQLYALELPLTWCGCPQLYDGGLPEADLFFMRDDGGLPGQLLESWRIGGIPVFQHDPEPLLVMSLLRPNLKAGDSFWVGVSVTDPETLLHWWVTERRVFDDVGVRYGSGPWFINRGDQPALRVHKNPSTVPTPAALAMLLVGVGLTATRRARQLARRCRERTTVTPNEG